MTLAVEIRQCLNCGREHEFYYGWPGCDPSVPHGFMRRPDTLSLCMFCDRVQSYPIHDRTGASEVKHCANCNTEHWFVREWPDCDPHQPHGFMTYQGMEGRCQFCGGAPTAFIHNKEHRA